MPGRLDSESEWTTRMAAGSMPSVSPTTVAVSVWWPWPELDVTIMPGGPQVNNRLMLPTGRLDFLMGGNMLQAFSAVENDSVSRMMAS